MHSGNSIEQLIVSYRQLRHVFASDAIRKRYYRGPLAIVCKKEQVNLPRSMNREKCGSDNLENLVNRLRGLGGSLLSDLAHFPLPLPFSEHAVSIPRQTVCLAKSCAESLEFDKTSPVDC